MIDRSAPLPLRDFDNLEIPVPDEVTLSNGIRVVSLDMGDQPVVRLVFRFPGGLGDYRCPETLALAYQLLGEGSVGIDGSEISEIFEFNGAWFASEVSSHAGSVSLSVMTPRFKNVFPTLLDIITRPNPNAKIVRSVAEKLAATERLKMKKMTYLAEGLDARRMFGINHPLARQFNPERFAEICKEEVNDALSRTLLASAPTVYVAGNVAPIFDCLCRSLEKLTFSGTPVKIEIHPFEADAAGIQRIVVDDVLQSAVKMSLPAIGRSHPDYIPLRLAVMALGGYFGSRLMQNIREDKGLTYGISAHLLGYREGGVVSIDAQTDNRYVDAVIDETRIEIKRMAEQSLTGELTSLKRHALSELATILDTPFSIMEHYISLEANNAPKDYFKRQVKTIQQLDADTLLYISRRHLDSSALRVSVAGA